MLLIGSVVERIPGPNYAQALCFAELRLRPPLPRVPTLRRKRHGAPEGLTFALRAPASALSSARGPLRFDAELERGLDWLLAASEALDARAVVLSTPTELTPGQRSRDLLAAYAERLPRESGVHWVWSPHGAWEPEDRYRLARSLGLDCGFNPFEEPRPTGCTAYACLRALGTRQRFSDATLDDVLAVMHGTDEEEAFIAIDSPRSFAEATRLRRMAEEALQEAES